MQNVEVESMVVLKLINIALPPLHHYPRSLHSRRRSLNRLVGGGRAFERRVRVLVDIGCRSVIVEMNE